ncbi:csm1-like protein [Claviceps africana]|uniref:Csm1-like protein n=1 Tax=Claviceps africana TaxID=83212 RepID=A0A8K0JA51_9HYPO|nr:csm1-like protein [Claviceps africana]
MSNPRKRAAEAAPDVQHDRKKKKKKSKSKARQDDEAIDLDLGVNTLFTRMDNQLLADYLAQKLTRFGGDLSSVEISDLTLSAGSIRDTATEWRRDRTLANLPAFLENFSGGREKLTEIPEDEGSPHTLIVTSAGLRAADICRTVREGKLASKGNPPAKLFAKHIKIEEQVTFLRTRKTGIGVGTPARLIELMEIRDLKLHNLQRVVVDASHVDKKKRGIMDMKDTLMPLARFLTRPEFRERYGDEEKPLALLFY